MDIPKFPASAGVGFRTKLQQATEILRAIAPGLPRAAHRSRVAVAGA